MKYFTELPKKDKSVEKNSRYNRIMRKLNRTDIFVQVHFLISAGGLFDWFLTMFQSDCPLIHVLHDKMGDLLRQVYLRFLKIESIDNLDASQLSKVDVAKSEYQLDDTSMDIGEPTRSALKNIPKEQRRGLLLSIRKCYQTMARYLQEKLPLKNRMLESLSVFNPMKRKNPDSAEKLRYVANHLKHIVDEHEVSRALDEFRLYQLDNHETYDRVDEHWSRVSLIEVSSGVQKYPTIVKLAKTALSFGHGNANVERGFSTNKRTVTDDRTRLSAESVNAIRNVKDWLSFNGVPIEQVKVTSDMLRAHQEANQIYTMRKAQEAEAEKKKEAEHREQERRQKEKMDELERRQENMQKTAENVKASETDAFAELKVAEKMLDEGNARLSKAVRAKDMSEITFAQAMIETANCKMSEARKKMDSVRREVQKLEKEKNRMIDSMKRQLNYKPCSQDSEPSTSKKSKTS